MSMKPHLPTSGQKFNQKNRDGGNNSSKINISEVLTIAKHRYANVKIDARSGIIHAVGVNLSTSRDHRRWALNRKRSRLGNGV